MSRPSPKERRLVQELVEHYELNQPIFSTFLKSLQEQITSSRELAPYIHSLKWRIKDPKSLKDKLFRKIQEAKEEGRSFSMTKENLFVRVNDLAGLRILHLNTDQLSSIAHGLKELFAEESYTLFEKPSARTWDDESRVLLTGMGFKIVSKPSRPSFYTSVHYVIKPNKKTQYTCEIQVRTLMEEVWGEVDHRLNYPNKTTIIACREQLAALARATSSCSRLVDSIFRSHEDLNR
jgi:putative GTP pyrophosphokinase